MYGFKTGLSVAFFVQISSWHKKIPNKRFKNRIKKVLEIPVQIRSIYKNQPTLKKSETP